VVELVQTDVVVVVVVADGLASSALSSGPGSAPPPSSSLTDNFTPAVVVPPPSSALPPQPASQSKPPYAPPNAPTPGPAPGRPGLLDGGGFMAQQSQVFVFSTAMANQAADAVERGLCRTIIDFHVDQPRTRQFLQVLH